MQSQNVPLFYGSIFERFLEKSLFKKNKNLIRPLQIYNANALFLSFLYTPIPSKHNFPPTPKK